jgi:hypothetical protein
LGRGGKPVELPLPSCFVVLCLAKAPEVYACVARLVKDRASLLVPSASCMKASAPSTASKA